MAYEKTLWKTGDIVTEEKMNKIEQGIKSMELPAVTSEDDGKVLTVTDGQWALGNASGGGLKYVKDDPSDSGGVIEGLVALPDDAPTGTVVNSATGEYAHAEGRGTKAQASASHSEGFETIADGNWSHAEGGQTYTNRYAESSHAEGFMSKTFGYASHAEGYNSIASGNYSHAEGWDALAKSIASHAEGYGTIAGSDSQHAQGKYNIEDNQNIYAFIIGNGTTDNNRSNALGVKWDGTFAFANGTEITPTEFAQIKRASNLQIVKITVGQSGVTCSHSRSDIEDMIQNEVPFIVITGGDLCHIIPSQVGSFWYRMLSSVNVQDKILNFDWLIFDVDNNKDVSVRLFGSEEVTLQTT